MDKIEEAASVIVDLNKYRIGEIEDFQLIKSVCSFFDKIKDEKISESDLKFLKYIANIVGIPHFYDLLNKFNHDINLDDFDLNTFSAIIYESTLNLDEKNKVHKYQKQILEKFESERPNRYFLSASTSFGKTHIVFEIIKKMNYKNIVLIFPTIALLSENLERLTSNTNYEYFLANYSFHTLSEVGELGEKNIFIYTPERFLSFIEKQTQQITFNFAFIDEVYKIDNEYIIDEEVRENERDVAYRLAVFEALTPNTDALLAGPYIDFTNQSSQNYNPSFNRFLSEFEIKLIDYNNYEIVNKTYTDIKSKAEYLIDKDLHLRFDDKSKEKRLLQIIKSILSIRENTIIYCFSRGSVESYTRKIIESGILSNHDSAGYANFITHITSKFKEEWILVEALKNGIGIHHGLIPKYLQKEIVSLFNEGQLKILISTTTITEGVNTSAKNLVVLHSKKGDKDLKKFDAKNIAGRAGRFLYHYSGRVIVLNNDFMEAINSEPEGIKHKNYDLNAPKDEIDLFYTRDEFLINEDKQRVLDIRALQLEKDMPDFIFDLYKVVSRLDKIKVYEQIQALKSSDLNSIKLLIQKVSYKLDIDYDGFQAILRVIEPIVLNQKLKFLIEYKGLQGEHSSLTHLVHYYLQGGYLGSVDYKLRNGKNIDKAISETSEFVYNTLKYQVVKYLGVFNILYKLFISQTSKQSYDEVVGIDRLLTKLEYNAFTVEGRIVSDYGVPSSVVDYYENTGERRLIAEGFDNYEMSVFEKVQRILPK